MSEGFMSDDQAEVCIWGFFAQLDRSRDRRKVMSPEDQALLMEQKRAASTQQEAGWWDRIEKAKARWLTPDRRKAAEDDAVTDALGELEAGKDLRGKVNHATGLPESSGDLETGRGMISGVDLCMSVLVPPRSLACASTAWLPPGGDENVESDWQVMSFKAIKTACTKCKSKGRLDGPLCKRCKGRGHWGKGLFRRKRVWCKPCQGHGRLTGPVCDECEGKGNIEGWSEEEHETVNHNTRQISRAVTRMAGNGWFRENPIAKEDVEMGDLTWEDDEGNTLGFKLTYSGYKQLQDLIKTQPDLRRAVHSLEYAGEEVRSRAPQWAQDEYSQQT